jgi:hypothetical protein
MEIHGVLAQLVLMGELLLLGRRRQYGQHCTAALRRGRLWSIAMPLK